MLITDFRIKCKISRDSGFTAGKEYLIQDGRIIDNEGVPRPAAVKKGFRFTSLDEIKNYKDGNWSWIGEFTKVN